MPDMLVKLFEVPDARPVLDELSRRDIVVRRAISTEKLSIVTWVGKTFSTNWVSECEVAMSTSPTTCFIAIHQGKVIGFACHDAFAYKNMLGPIGVDESYRGQKVGKALLLVSLHAMAAQGYAYGIIAWAGPPEFYANAAGATIIEGSEPPIYRQLLREPTA